MDVVRHAVAGTLESSDIFLEVLPCQEGIEIELESIVMNQYGGAIRGVIRDTLEKHHVSSVLVKAVDRGALDCVIRARVETALERSAKESVQ